MAKQQILISSLLDWSGKKKYVSKKSRFQAFL